MMRISKLIKVSVWFSLTSLTMSAHSEIEVGKDSIATVVPVAKVEPSPLMPSSLKTHNIGAAAGFISGYGLTYRHWCPSLNGYQITFIPVGRLNDDESYFNSSIGAIGLRHFTERKPPIFLVTMALTIIFLTTHIRHNLIRILMTRSFLSLMTQIIQPNIFYLREVV